MNKHSYRPGKSSFMEEAKFNYKLLQGTMPSSTKNPSSIPMWRGVKVAYTIIATSLFPLAIAGYWAYGNLVSIALYL